MARKLGILAAIALAAAAVSVAWQFASVTISNRELQSDLREIAAQIGGRSGLSAPSSEDDLRNTVIKRAAEDGITLRPEEITVRRTETEGNWAVFLSADYDVSIGLPGFARSIHFSESASHE